MSKIRNFKDFISLLIKGACVGIAMFIPGVSGGTLALMLGIYEDLIESVAGIRKHFKDSIIYLIPVLCGGIIGYALALLILGLGLKYIPIPTISLFAGLIIGGIPSIASNLKGEDARPNWKNLLSFALAFLVVIALALLSIKLKFNVTIENIKFQHYLLILFGGVVTSFALIVPGVSGSAVLLTIGLYGLIVLESIPGVFKFNNLFGKYVIIDLLFVLGAIIGLLLISKLMKYLLKNKKVPTFYAILGFVTASIFAIYFNDTVLNGRDTAINNLTFYELLNQQPWQYALVVVLLIVGILGSLFLDKLSKKLKEKEVQENC